METFTCNKCGVEKPLNSDYFHKNKRNKNGFVHNCKVCQNKIATQWWKSNPKKNRAKRQKRRASVAELPNDLTDEEWNITLNYFNHECAYCGNKKSSLHQEHVQALSRGGGYTQGNIIPACKRCNTSKRDKDMFTWYGVQDFFSPDRLEKIEDYLLEFGNVRKVKRYYLDGFGPDGDNNIQK